MQSTLYTIGTALSRARDHGVVVRVLVSGHWIEGLVSDVDRLSHANRSTAAATRSSVAVNAIRTWRAPARP